jgi:hypothetical protein
MGKKADDKPIIIYCKKCDGANEFGNDVCKYCNEPISKYNLKEDYYVKQDEKGIIGYVIALIYLLLELSWD